MYRQLHGRVVRANSDDGDPLVDLMVAMILRARRDLELPIRRKNSTSGRFPSAEEKAEAKEFLAFCIEEFSSLIETQR